MARDSDRDDATAEGEEMVRDGNLVIEERINRRDGLVEYEGTVEGGAVAGTSASGGRTTPAAASRVTTTETVTTETVPARAQTVATGVGSGGSGSLSMSTDNTAEGRLEETAATGPIAMVREGMSVVDASGEEIGAVDRVQMGDPSAATAMGQDAGDDVGVAAAPVGLAGSGGSGTGVAGGGIAAPIAAFGGGDLDLPESFAADLMRVGFVKIDGKGWFDRDRYAAADEIADVSGDTVRLSVGKDALRTS